MSCSSACADLEVLYGQTPRPTETPSLLEESMKGFRELLEKEERENSNWRLAEGKCPKECSDEFKLVFLRCEVFQVELAVKRYIKYWDNRIEIFGVDKGFLPILALGGSPGGAMKDDLEAINCAYIRMAAPNTCEDPDGRAICFIDGTVLDAIVEADNSSISIQGLVRASWYATHIGLQSESTQQKGIVLIYRAAKKISSVIKKSPGRALEASIKGALPIRLAAMHVLDPSPIISILSKLARAILGKELQKRIYLHKCGSLEKKLESLKKFGIGRVQLPSEVGGDFDFNERKISSSR